MDSFRDLNKVAETLAKSKSIVKESLDLTRRNAERKKSIGRRLKNCFDIESNPDPAYSQPLETPQQLLANKEIFLGSPIDSEFLYENSSKVLNSHKGSVEYDKNFTQQKLEEIQELVKELEEENFSLKSKMRLLVSQIKEEENSVLLSKSEFENINSKLRMLEHENRELLRKNNELTCDYAKLSEENKELKHAFIIVKEENQQILNSNFKVLSEVKKIDSNPCCEVKNTVKELKSENSTYEYLQYFKNLKKLAFESMAENTGKLALLPRTKKNEQATDTRSENTTEGPEDKHIKGKNAIKIRKETPLKKNRSISFDNLEYDNQENSNLIIVDKKPKRKKLRILKLKKQKKVGK